MQYMYCNYFFHMKYVPYFSVNWTIRIGIGQIQGEPPIGHSDLNWSNSRRTTKSIHQKDYFDMKIHATGKILTTF